MRLSNRQRLFAGGAVVFLGMAAGYYFIFSERMSVSDSPELHGAVRANPPVAIVFTSRSGLESFDAAAPEAEGFRYPGTIPWAAKEGRLRMLKPDGKVYELTWNRPLPDGGTLIDVMGPSVTLDARRILFAGRRAAPDPGRWRLYRVDIDGDHLEPITGGADDAGCIGVPPLRYGTDGAKLDDAARKRLDYDDVDPADVGLGRIAFASSRLPDLGRDHSRRATQIWLLPAPGAAPRALTANRNNDRWPTLVAAEQLIVFSLWSRNREVIAADGESIGPFAEGVARATDPTDLWMGARLQPDGAQFGYAAKLRTPVWRPRPLFNGKLAFMTRTDDRMRLAQTEWGALQVAGSSLASGTSFPKQSGGATIFGPELDQEGRTLSAGCPNPCPGGLVLFAGAPVGSPPGAYGIYLVPQEWSTKQLPQLLFDDPELADAEPVAVYERPIVVTPSEPVQAGPRSGATGLKLSSGVEYIGSAGLIVNGSINERIIDPFPGFTTDTGAEPLIPNPTGVKSIVFYGARRDRFDDPVRPRIVGAWEKLLVSPLENRGFQAWIPADPMLPTVLAGLGADGKVVKWSGAKDSAGRAGLFYAVAGDHYSGTRSNGYHFCTGCHSGHTYIPADIAERAP